MGMQQYKEKPILHRIMAGRYLTVIYKDLQSALWEARNIMIRKLLHARHLLQVVRQGAEGDFMQTVRRAGVQRLRKVLYNP
jgi:hypothetical protein